MILEYLQHRRQEVGQEPRVPDTFRFSDASAMRIAQAAVPTACGGLRFIFVVDRRRDLPIV